MTRIEIPFSKKKLIIGIVFSFLFIVLGLFILTSNEESKIYSLFIKSFGILGILFFGITGTYGVKKMFDKKKGLVIDDSGIIDNSSMSSIGLIEWTDISEIAIEETKSALYLLIFTNDNGKYLEKTRGLKRMLIKSNIKNYGTPISIISNTLNCDFYELESILKEKLNEQKNKMPNR